MAIHNYQIKPDNYTSSQQLELYQQLRERANTRLKRARRGDYEIFANKRVSKYLERRGYRYFPKSVTEKNVKGYLSELLLYTNDRTSTKTGVNQVLDERWAVFAGGRNKSGVPLISRNVTAKDLDTLLRSEEWSSFKQMFLYSVVLEDFSDAIELGGSAEEFIGEMRSWLNSIQPTEKELLEGRTREIDYSGFRRHMLRYWNKTGR